MITVQGVNELFKEQTQRLIERGYHHASGRSKEAFLRDLLPLENYIKCRIEKISDALSSVIPFTIAFPARYLPRPQQISLASYPFKKDSATTEYYGMETKLKRENIRNTLDELNLLMPYLVIGITMPDSVIDLEQELSEGHPNRNRWLNDWDALALFRDRPDLLTRHRWDLVSTFVQGEPLSLYLDNTTPTLGSTKFLYLFRNNFVPSCLHRWSLELHQKRNGALP